MHAQTRRQREVLDFITRYIDSHGYRPSYQLIARHMGVRSRAGIGRIVRDLEAQGLITRRRENGHFFLDVGSNSNIAAGSGIQITWLSIPDETEDGAASDREPFTIPDFMIRGNGHEMYRAFLVPDDAMAADGIMEDDIALVELREFVRDGDRVVAVINKRRTVLRKYYRAGAHVELCAAGDGEILKLAADRVELKGVYRGLLRLA